MTGIRLRLLMPALLLALTAGAASAQARSDVLERAVRAYRDLDFATATGLLRRALAPGQDARLSAADQARALTYLGAAELFRGNRDSADAAFERLVVLDPRYVIDELVFPPEISNRFQAIRRRTPAVVVATPPTAELVPGRDRFSILLYVSAVHEVAAELRTSTGGPVRVLYRGLVGDSLEVPWDGRNESGALVDGGQYLLVVESHGSSGIALRYVHVPLEIAVERPEMLPDPGPFPDSLRRSRNTSTTPGLGALAVGTAGSLAVALLPRAFAPGARPSQARLLIGGTIGVAGAVGFLKGFAGRAGRGSVAANEAALRAWNERREAVSRENAARRESARLTIRARTPVTIDLRAR